MEAAAEDTETSTPAPPPPEISVEIKEKVDAKIKDPFKGISKSLLEKIRAKQVSHLSFSSPLHPPRLIINFV